MPSIRLEALDAVLLASTGTLGRWQRLPTISGKVAAADGVKFTCPGCEGHQIIIWFADRGRIPAEERPRLRWQASGDTVSDLTLTPSINLATPETMGGCVWHGYIVGGEAVW